MIAFFVLLGFLIIFLVVYFLTGDSAPPDSVIVSADNQPPVPPKEKVVVYSPRPNDAITSPLLIEGRAVGNWFFEASFPIKLLDSQGNELAMAIASAQSDWMTEDFVDFEATLEFDPPESGEAVLVFKKDNPSDLPEFDEELRVPVKFESANLNQQ